MADKEEQKDVAPTNPRGIPYAPFVDKVEDYVTSRADVETTLKSFQEMISKYQFMEVNQQRRASGLKDKMPDIQKTLDTVQFLKTRKPGSDAIEATFELNDTLFAKARIPPTEEVYLWLGANVMLSYPIDEAKELLSSKLAAAKQSLANCEEDLDFLREQITTMEVATARVYNWDVTMKRKEKNEQEGIEDASTGKNGTPNAPVRVLNMAAEQSTMTLDPKYDDYDFPTMSPNNQSGHPGHTTPQQDAQVHQLRMKLEQDGYTDRLDTLTLLRFLRARKFDVTLAEKMFVESEKWRKEINLDDLVQNFDYKEKKEVFEYYPQYYHKTDKDGRPVYIEQLGNIDLNAMYKITTSDRMLQNLAVEYEKLADPRLPACSRKSGNLLETCCTIMDLKGVGVTKVPSVYSYVKLASAMSQNYYPERLGRLYLINAPWGFSTVFSVVKGWLDPITVEKIHVLGSGYQKDLLTQVPAENLPKTFGGSCECEGGCEFSDEGPWTDPQWAKPPKWQTKAADANVIDNEATNQETISEGTKEAPAKPTEPVGSTEYAVPITESLKAVAAE
ncbi:hypothetical protein B7494_g1808 [Chlorociboria aeruginascens]|nr:hypothetical protein B7494_g1808 [Chlorociboria aeruginascens]